MFINSIQMIDTLSNSNDFSLSHTIETLKHYLPSQTPLKDFVHHNSLHAFQDKDFFSGIFTARDTFGYHVTLSIQEYRNLYNNNRISKAVLENIIVQKKGVAHINEWYKKVTQQELIVKNKSSIGTLRKKWKEIYSIDLDNKVQPTLFRVICAYLDQGVAITQFPHLTEGFLASVKALEKNSLTSFFTSKRAKLLLENENTSIQDLLGILVGNESYYFHYLFDQQFSHRGWSGMVATLENSQDSLLDKRIVSLSDFIHFELLLEIDALDQKFGSSWKALENHLPDINNINIFKSYDIEESDEILMIWQEAFEWSYYDNVLAGLSNAYQKTETDKTNKSFQAIFCIDERECSLRRHLESTDTQCATFGAPGFFGVAFYFQPENGKFYEKLCPAPVTPSILVCETNNNEPKKHSFLYHKISHTFLGGALFNVTAGIYSVFELIKNLVQPKMTPAISNAFLHVGANSSLSIQHTGQFDDANHLQIGFSIEEMVQCVKSQLLNMGLVKEFSPLVYVVAHGSSSANNPHHGAHDCGACSGRPGSVNARVFAFMANHLVVREKLKDQGIEIPANTQFVGALHDTAADQIAFFDETIISASNKVLHQQNVEAFETALDLNAKERSRRFASINTKLPIKEIRNKIKQRSVSLFEPRPELGHGSNALCIIGRRALSKQVFLDRRAFLNSYDYTIDPDGSILKNVIAPIGPVCGGINLEYYFSRIDNLKLGAGTKLPHNVMGLIGVANSSDGDLRPGLPLQMIEVHDPIRLLVIVEQDPIIVNNVLEQNPAIKDWYIKNWIHLMVMNPHDNQLYRYNKGQFEPYTIINNNISSTQNIQSIIENAPEMRSFTIEDATKENLPVYHLN